MQATPKLTKFTLFGVSPFSTTIVSGMKSFIAHHNTRQVTITNINIQVTLNDELH